MTDQTSNPTLDNELDKLFSLFEGGITAKGNDSGGYPTYFDIPYPIWLEKRKAIVKQAIKSLLREVELEARKDEHNNFKQFVTSEGRLNSEILKYSDDRIKTLESGCDNVISIKAV